MSTAARKAKRERQRLARAKRQEPICEPNYDGPAHLGRLVLAQHCRAGELNASPGSHTARFFHGAMPDLEPGTRLQPASEVGLGGGGIGAGDSVYITEIYLYAIHYAQSRRWSSGQGAAGAVYEVRPVGDLKPDPEHLSLSPGAAWKVPEAEVVRPVVLRDPWVFKAALRECGKVSVSYLRRIVAPHPGLASIPEYREEIERTIKRFNLDPFSRDQLLRYLFAECLIVDSSLLESFQPR